MSKGRHIHKRGKAMTDAEAHADHHERLLIKAQEIHDRDCRQCDPKYIRSCPRFAQAILDAGTDLRTEANRLRIQGLIQSCKASMDDINVPHTCGLSGGMYFQGNPHKHDGAVCVDWAHCTRTSDEQREGMQR